MRGKLLAIVALCFGSSVFMFLASSNFDFNLRHFLISLYDQQQLYLTTDIHSANIGDPINWLINTGSCKIAQIDPLNNTIRELIKKLPPFECNETNLVYLFNGTLYVNYTVKNQVLESINASESHDFHCCATFFKRFPEELDDYTVRTLGKCTKFRKSTKVLGEYMKIECYLGRRSIYTTYEVVVIRKKDVEARCNAIVEVARNQDRLCVDRLSVLILGVDSVSRLNAQRHLVETRRVLQELGAVEFLGYNKVGENTFPNMVAFLSGQSGLELRDGCWKGGKHFFDDCLFLWDDFAASGYRTAFVENLNHFGLFSYAKKGFRRQPADYYGRVFFNAAASHFATARGACVRRTVPEDEFVVQWASDFQREFAGAPHFGYFWISRFSHDLLNRVQYVDPFLSRDVRTMYNDGSLNSTLLVVMSDHGLRFGDILSTRVGKYEANLPFMFLLFPHWFGPKYPAAFDNLRNNARNRLATVFDLHHTMQDILYCSVDRNGPKSRGRWGISFFKSIPADRTCRSAGIPDQFCSCYHEEVPISVNGTLAKRVAAILVDHLNGLIAGSLEICAKLYLKAIDEVRGFLTEPSESVTYGDEITFSVVIITEPCNGMFEGCVMLSKSANEYTLCDGLKRINKYGNSSSCIKDEPKLLPICCCV